MKNPTQWITKSGFSTVTDANAGYDLLLETAFHLLLETGFKLILEDTVVTVKEATAWVEV